MTKKVDFIAGCPIKGCPNKKEEIHWKHKIEICGAYEIIEESGYVRCKSGHDLGYFYELFYRCSGHHDFKQGDGYQSYYSMLSIISDIPGNSEFVDKLIDVLKEQRKKGVIK